MQQHDWTVVLHRSTEPHHLYTWNTNHLVGQQISERHEITEVDSIKGLNTMHIYLRIYSLFMQTYKCGDSYNVANLLNNNSGIIAMPLHPPTNKRFASWPSPSLFPLTWHFYAIFNYSNMPNIAWSSVGTIRIYIYSHAIYRHQNIN